MEPGDGGEDAAQVFCVIDEAPAPAPLPPAPSAALTPIHQSHVTDLVGSVSFGWWFSYHMLTT